VVDKFFFLNLFLFLFLYFVLVIGFIDNYKKRKKEKKDRHLYTV
jgi:preprotein translocase subunit SecG